MSPALSKLLQTPPEALYEFLKKFPGIKGKQVAIGLSGANSFSHVRTSKHTHQNPSAYVAYLVLHRLIIWPFVLSPLRKLPGPPVGNLIFGQSRTIINSETGIPQREWVKQYGPVIRLVGPVGMERLICMTPEALHQILVKDWLQYSRVFPVIPRCNLTVDVCSDIARISAKYPWDSRWIRVVNGHRR
jgi:hypothetical protein